MQEWNHILKEKEIKICLLQRVLYLCKELLRPPFCRGGPCGTWRGSGDTLMPAAAWRRATGVWHRPRSWKESDIAWGWTHGLCVGDSWFCRPGGPAPCPPPSCTLPRWHTESADGQRHTSAPLWTGQYSDVSLDIRAEDFKSRWRLLPGISWESPLSQLCIHLLV